MNKILVIGGSNIDYLAKSENPLVFKDSNIGNLNISFGGVGRNIALDLSLIKNNVTFITGLSNDNLSLDFRKELEEHNIKVLIPKSKYGVGSYIAICDNLGEMYIAICESKFCDNLEYKELSIFQDEINNHENIVLDANLNQKLIEDIIKHNPNKKYYVDAVSANKVSRFKNVLSSLFLFKSNLIEAQSLLNKKDDGDKLVKSLLSLGVKNVIITSGSNNIYYGHDNNSFVTSSLKIKKDAIKSVNGAGDAFFAGFVSSYIKSNDIASSIEIAKKMSYYTLLSYKAVNEDISNLIENN